MRARAFLISISLAGALLTPVAGARDGDRSDRGERVHDRAAEAADRAAQRAAEQAARDTTRFVDEQAKIEARATEERAKARSPEELAKAEDRAADEQAKLDADRAKAEVRADEEAAKAAEDIAEAEAKDAEEAAKAAEDAAEDSSGSSDPMGDLAKSENPEYDDGGFPVRRGEIVALDLKGVTRRDAEARGFRVVGETRLSALGATVTRLSVPEGLSARDALEAIRRLDGSGVFDFTHYYALNVGAAGEPDGTEFPAMKRRAGDFRVGIIDTSVARHPALDGVALTIRDFSGGGANLPTQHGTAVASLLAGEGGTSLLVANVFTQDMGQPFTSADAIARALEWMAEMKVDVVNISLAGPPNDMLNHVIAQAIARGHSIVAAAGNDGPTAPPAYPAADAGVVAVTAVDATRRVYRYANHGAYITVAARGVNVPAAAPDGRVSGFSGTSFAAPVVSGYLARCLGEQARDREACMRRLEGSAQDLGAPGRDPVMALA